MSTQDFHYANLLSASVTQGSAPTLSVSVNASNQITNPGFSYDAAGNMLADGSFSYTYDAENRMKTGAGVTYTYDGDGKRVQKSNGKLYWYGMGSDPLAESDGAGNISDEYIFFGGRRIARRHINATPPDTITYYFADHLGTSRVVTSATGAILDDSDFYPFGGERPAITPSGGNNYKFTGKQRDSESGLDNFVARYYSSSIGRFMTPDWSAAPMGVPYADFADPQSLNLYSYAKNRPLTYIDREGHCTEPLSFAACVVVGAAAVSTRSISCTSGIRNGKKQKMTHFKNRSAARQAVRNAQKEKQEHTTKND